ncbi:universal stress protein [Solitalea sp. MAHUQ-68]|uniref:Universal stress protein n=1 Tax=Solitalea agri TaxID=2953739 RepID=A0A9X2F0G8_9SPHI|nr:universal stress protein [Solitalea agri]MCO4291800.1 universal stress protein [Solitalea agri]
MKTILVPTDFSKSANNALMFAKNLAVNHNYRIKLLHIVQTMVDPNMPPEIIDEVLTTQENEAKEQNEALQKEIASAGVEVESITRRGFLIESEILEELTAGDINLIIMGTKGVADLVDKLLGSNTSSIIERATCPVLVVPSLAKPDKAIKKIVYATQFHGEELPFIERILDFSDSINAETTILKITTSDKQEESLINKLNLSSSSHKCKIETFSAHSVSEGISEYAKKNNTDLLVMVTHRRTLLEKFFNPSITKKLAEHVNVPLLAYHG